MKTRLFAGLLGALLAVSTLSAADEAQRKSKNPQQDSDMQRAIAFERYKDMAAARQARLEAKHPTVYNNADRSANPNADKDEQGRKIVKDKGKQ
jgi:hypothetical protein